MKLGRWLVLLALSFVDVRVRAANQTFDAAADREAFKFNDARVVIAKGGLAVADGTKLRLVRGRALVLGSLSITTPFARLECTGACEALFERSEDRLDVEALTVGWVLHPTGSSAPREIPVATAVTLTGVDRSGVAGVSRPQSLAWAPLIRRWAALYPDGAEAFTNRVQGFRADWDLAVARVTDLDHDRALAMVTADARAKARILSDRAAREAEDARLRKAFRERNYVD